MKPVSGDAIGAVASMVICWAGAVVAAASINGISFSFIDFLNMFWEMWRWIGDDHRQYLHLLSPLSPKL
jgi:hypothetical protein